MGTLIVFLSGIAVGISITMVSVLSIIHKEVKKVKHHRKFIKL